MKCIRTYLHKTQFICERYQVSELSVWESPPQASFCLHRGTKRSFLVKILGPFAGEPGEPVEHSRLCNFFMRGHCKKAGWPPKKRVQPSKKIMASTGLLTDSDFSQIWFFFCAGDVVSFGGWDPVQFNKTCGNLVPGQSVPACPWEQGAA